MALRGEQRRRARASPPRPQRPVRSRCSAPAPIDGDLPLLQVDDPAADDRRPCCTRAGRAWPRASVTALVREHGLEVIGVTGSSGKTSTKDLIAAVLRSAPSTPPEHGGRAAGVVQQRTRPPLHGAAGRREHPLPGAGAVRPRASGTSRMLAATAPPRIGAVLNVGSAHIGEFGSVEAIAKAKSELVQALPAGRRRRRRHPERRRPAGRRDGRGHHRRGRHRRRGRRAPLIRAEDVTQDDADRARLHPGHPGGQRAGRAARWSARTRSATR